MRGGASRKVGRTLRISWGSFSRLSRRSPGMPQRMGRKFHHHALRDVRRRRNHHRESSGPMGSATGPMSILDTMEWVRHQHHLGLSGGAGSEIQDRRVGGSSSELSRSVRAGSSSSAFRPIFAAVASRVPRPIGTPSTAATGAMPQRFEASPGFDGKPRHAPAVSMVRTRSLAGIAGVTAPPPPRPLARMPLSAR